MLQFHYLISHTDGYYTTNPAASLPPSDLPQSSPNKPDPVLQGPACPLVTDLRLQVSKPFRFRQTKHSSREKF